MANPRPRPLIFKWRHFEPHIILCAIRWYLRFSLSYRDVKELLTERGVEVDHSTIWRWVQRFAPELNQRLRPRLKPTNRSWRVDETYVRVKGRWCYLYRAIDSQGATIEFFLSAFRDLDAAKSLFRRALRNGAHPQPRVINTDLAPTYASAIPALQGNGIIGRRSRHRPVQYLNNIIEQDHRAIQKRVNAKQGFRAFGAARRTIDGYEAVRFDSRPELSPECRKRVVRNRSDGSHFVRRLIRLASNQRNRGGQQQRVRNLSEHHRR